MRTIAVSNYKGGVGKTTTAVNLAAIYAGRGLRTLLVDLDPQASTTDFFGLYERAAREGRGTVRLLYGNEPVKGSAFGTGTKNLSVVPSTIELVDQNELLLREQRLRFALDDCADAYDVCIVDCSPTMKRLAFNAYLAAAGEGMVIVPVKLDSTVMRGTTLTVSAIESISDALRVPTPEWRILRTCVPGLMTNAEATGAAVLDEYFPDRQFSTVIHASSKVCEGSWQWQPVTTFKPDSRPAKDYEALAVIKYYQERNARVLLLCPKRLRDNWTPWTNDNDDRNPLADDRFSYTVLNHTDLSRYYGKSGEVDLEHLRWGNFDLLVIDESHNFRNKSTDSEKKDRYTRLIEDVIKSGRRTKVLMLSATPVNNRLLDLRNQIELITEGDDAYLANTDGIPSITQVTRVAQQRFNEWTKLEDGERTTESFAAMVNADYFKLLDVLTIARSRKHIMKYYGAGTGTFPKRRKPLSFKTPIDLKGELPAIGELNDMIAQLTFAQYQLLSYVRFDKVADYEARSREGRGRIQ